MISNSTPKYISKENEDTSLKRYSTPIFIAVSKENEDTSLKRYSTPIFIAALFTMAKIWKQIICTMTDEWIKKMR